MTKEMKPNNELRLLRLAGYTEGSTLLLLVFVAIPLKRFFDTPEMVSFIGPIHGLTFVLYLVFAVNAVSGGGWSPREVARLLLASIIPFGTLLNDSFLATKGNQVL